MRFYELFRQRACRLTVNRQAEKGPGSTLKRALERFGARFSVLFFHFQAGASALATSGVAGLFLQSSPVAAFPSLLRPQPLFYGLCSNGAYTARSGSRVFVGVAVGVGVLVGVGVGQASAQ